MALHKGISDVSGEPVPCELAKVMLNERIQGIVDQELIGNLKRYPNMNEESFDEQMLIEFDESVDLINLNINKWLEQIEIEARRMVDGQDDGDRDNLFQNEQFAKHFLRLCKMLPLWGSISCQFFDTPFRTGSSWSSETWFKNLKQMHGSNIPCSVDEFVKRDLQLTNGIVISASRKYLNKKDVIPSPKPSASQSSDANSNIVDEGNEVQSLSFDDNNTQEDHAIGSLATTTQNQNCIACENGDYPTGMHKCISCSKAIHILLGCSISVGDTEGCGEARKCMSCYKDEQEQDKIDRQSQKINEMNTRDVWKKRRDFKSSKYIKSVPNWDLIDIKKKVKIGYLINANRSRTFYKIDGKNVSLQNTCAIDALIQLLAGGYAYNTLFRSYVDGLEEPLYEIVKLMGKK